MPDVVVIGGGPAGLAAAYELAGKRSVLLLERESTVGGLSKTVEHRGFCCDIGGHRFFTTSPYVQGLWREVLGEELVRRPRLSRIYWRGRFVHYPLRPADAALKLGPATAVRVVGSFLAARWRRRRPPSTFADFVRDRFGARLFEIFFRSYTEKVWGIPCEELSADWAVQRIRNLSLGRAILDAVRLIDNRSTASLIDEFDYPLYGPGQMYTRMAGLAVARGAELRVASPVVQVEHDGSRVTAVGVERGGAVEHLEVGAACLSSMPLDELVLQMTPPAPSDVREAAAGLRYRSLITVNLLLDVPSPLPDTWLYIHDPGVVAARLQCYSNWSPNMAPTPDRSVVGLEYFCTEGDELWRLEEAALVDLARRDMDRMALVDTSRLFDAFAIRSRKAYPVYDRGYADRVRRIRSWLEPISNLYPIGRYGQFRYNNMDHSILSAHYSVLALGGCAVDPWSVEAEAGGPGA